MKKYLLLLFCFLNVLSYAQIEGTWKGDIQIPMQKLPFVITIEKHNNEWIGIGESPQQTNNKINFKTVTFQNDTLKIDEPKLGMQYIGVLKDNTTIEGKFSQRGMTFTLNLEKGEYKLNRPQMPSPPFAYDTKEITFYNDKADINLSGTLTIPKGKAKYPTVILVTGSGPQDRDETIAGHKPFLVIADYLSKNGYAVLRYDDRGVGESEGKFSEATILDFATDTEAAINYLKKQKFVDNKKIGILGHSEGGMVAQIVAAHSKDIHFIISLAGPGIPNDQLMIIQKTAIERAMGIPELSIKMNERVFGKMYKIAKKDTPNEVAEAEIKNFLKNDPVYKNIPENQLQELIDQVLNKWFRASIKYDPNEYFSEIKAKVLALNGEKDLQVTAKENLKGWKDGLAHNKYVTVKSYPKLNHMFQKAVTGLPNEYGEIETTIEPVVLEDILNWLNENVK